MERRISICQHSEKEQYVKSCERVESLKIIKKCYFYVKFFRGAKVRCMKDDAKLSVRQKPDHFFFSTSGQIVRTAIPAKRRM